MSGSQFLCLQTEGSTDGQTDQRTDRQSLRGTKTGVESRVHDLELRRIYVGSLNNIQLKHVYAPLPKVLFLDRFGRVTND